MSVERPRMPPFSLSRMASPSPVPSTSSHQDHDRATPPTKSFDNKLNLTVQVESSPQSTASPPTSSASSWQQPYSELSRFPSASFRFKGKDWRPDGSKYMTPLPSPLDTRSRSLSDAASDVSTSADLSSEVSENVHSSSSKPPARSKTMQFFETMDSAFSPPPPPRIASANYDHSKRNQSDDSPNVQEVSAGQSGGDSVVKSETKTKALSLHTTNSSSKDQSSGLVTSTADPPSSPPAPGSAPPFNIDTLPALPNLSLDCTPIKAVPHRHDLLYEPKPTTPTISTVLGRHTVLEEASLPSPSESQTPEWSRQPPTRLPTLINEPWTSPAQSRSSKGSVSATTASALRSGFSPSKPSDEQASNFVNFPRHLLTAADERQSGYVLGEEYEVVRNLGLGAFSTVVLARKLKATQKPIYTNSVRSSPSASPTRGPRSHKSSRSGSYPSSIGYGHARSRSMGTSALRQSAKTSSSSSDDDTDPPASEIQARTDDPSSAASEHNMVAVKMISRNHIAKNDRMRISIIREVEVLKHIRHPSLVHLTASFDTLFHTCLVLEYSSGGELFDFLANFHEQISDALARRIFGELADVLGWMHSIGLVHRDIKLENILLTARPFSQTQDSSSKAYTYPDPSSLPNLPSPFVKLTDFGLSRFIDPSSPFLETRCGSEEYAAPELIMGKRYDGRQTDAWALGVVLYAIITGSLPFVEELPLGASPGIRSAVSPSGKGNSKARRSYLLKIAKGEYTWPSEPENYRQPGNESLSRLYFDATRMATDEVKKLVGALLSRDVKKRIKVEDVWDFSWVQGSGTPEKRSIRGGNLDGVALTEFAGDDERAVRTEVPEFE